MLNLLTDQELIAASGKTLVFDIECYPNYFLIAFKELESGKVLIFENSPEAVIDIRKLMWVLRSFLLVGFNSKVYDIVLIWLACAGATVETLKRCSDDLIKYGKTETDVESKYAFRVFETNHIDLISVAPLEGSLKLYAARLHAPKIQDLPFHPEQSLSREEAEIVRCYCVNDLDCTALLYQHLSPQIKLREELGRVYDKDLRSKSDAQIAETVIRSEVQRITGTHIKRPQIAPGTAYKYRVPRYIEYRTKELQEVLEKVRRADFIVNDKGSIDMPKELDGLKIALGACVYRLGIGGLHSSEKQVCHKANEDTLLIDVDCTSYYPSIILTLGLYPSQMKNGFLDVYKNIVNRRIEAKRSGNKIIADALKIVINSSFGKFGNKYSSLYSPSLLIQVTLTGQLALLLLIEQIELANIPVISGNTDGILIKCAKSKYQNLKKVIALWEKNTGFATEKTRYKAIFSKDVNNYLALYE